MAESTPIVKSTDMDDEQKKIVSDIVSTSYKDLKTKPSELAADIKVKLDEKLGAPWHIVVGKSFSSSISHEKNGFIYVYIDNFAILCFRTA